MKLFRLFGLLSIIALMVASQYVLSVKAETVNKDFGQTNFNSSDYSGHNIFCTINVKADIQTEPNGNWVAGNTYGVNWIITITYLNQSLYNNNDFSIVCSNPVNVIYDTVGQNTTVYQTTVTPQNSGILSAIFKPSTPMSFTLESSFSLTVYNKGNIVTSGSWQQSYNNEPMTVNVVSQQVNPSPTVPELTPIVLGAALVAVTSSVLIYRKSKQKLSC